MRHAADWGGPWTSDPKQVGFQRPESSSRYRRRHITFSLLRLIRTGSLLSTHSIAFQREMLSKRVEPATHTEQDDQPLDGDSLFGSPPPSPVVRGRLPSPISVLPSESSAGPQALSSSSSAQNVGTIALPGSRAHSEQSINPIAISLSLPGGSCTPLLPQSLPSSQPQSRHGSVGFGRNLPSRPVLPPRPRSSPEHQRRSTISRKPPKQKSQEPASRPPPLTISLPDPSQPPPPHFLRSQQALLGHAGLIGRIQPSKLSTSVNTPRGATPSNPIVLEDSETSELPEPPVIGRSHIGYFKNINPSKLPPPTNQEVVDMLIKQKDIFPVLQSILKLMTTGALGGKAAAMSTVVPGSGSWTLGPADQGRSSPQPPPAKKRKLTRVPAGAADWDVPYPFQEGEGPMAYKQNWSKERGRQLISQLIGLVKIAARKAAAKKHLVELQQKRQDTSRERGREKQGQKSIWQEGGRGAKHYRDENGNPNLATTTPHHQPTQIAEPQVSVTSSFGNLNTESSGSAAECSTSASTASFNDFFSALLAASNADDTTSSRSTPLPSGQPLGHPTPPQSAFNPLTLFDTPSPPSGNVGQSIVDSWMNFFQTFEVDPHSSQDVSLETLLGLDSPIGDLSSFASPTSGDLSSFSTTPNTDVQQVQSFPPLDFGQLGDLDLALTASAGSSSSGLGSLSPSTTDTTIPMDFAFDLRATTPNSQAHVPTTEENLPTMDVDQPLQSLNPHIPTTSISALTANTDFSSLIDPQLLALSMPDHNSPTQLQSSSTPQSQDARKTESNITDACSPSTFLPSPISSFDPATPSSAGWDMSMPEVIATESDRDQGGVVLSRMAQESLGYKDVTGVGDAHLGASGTSTKEIVSGLVPGGEIPKSKTQLPAMTSATPGPSQPSGVFQVLRAADLQPPKPVPKLKKSEVLKRAEERREELKAKLDQAKVKLWEATIEHGALMHLMRSAGEADKTSSSQGP